MILDQLQPPLLVVAFTIFSSFVLYLVVSSVNFALGFQLRRCSLFTICDKFFSIQDTPALATLPRDELQRGYFLLPSQLGASLVFASMVWRS